MKEINIKIKCDNSELNEAIEKSIEKLEKLKKLKEETKVKDEKRSFKVGDRVKHEKYGTGILLKTNMFKDSITDTEFVVIFDKKQEGGHDADLGDDLDKRCFWFAEWRAEEELEVIN